VPFLVNSKQSQRAALLTTQHNNTAITFIRFKEYDLNKNVRQASEFAINCFPTWKKGLELIANSMTKFRPHEKVHLIVH